MICVFVFFSDSNKGYVGLILTQIISVVSRVQWGMRQLAALENQMNSVKRVIEYKEIPQEADPESSLGIKRNCLTQQYALNILFFSATRTMAPFWENYFSKLKSALQFKFSEYFKKSQLPNSTNGKSSAISFKSIRKFLNHP